MGTRKRAPLLKPTMLLELASHASMGAALGLALALILFVTPTFGVGELIKVNSHPHDMLRMLVGTYALMFGVGAALTALAFKLIEDES
jgi:protein-S-isoprenylcysteine O-methyltransferase Ste14